MNDYADRTKEELLVVIQRQANIIGELQESQDWLDCLESAGVDNWCGYEYAQELAEELAEDS